VADAPRTIKRARISLRNLTIESERSFMAPTRQRPALLALLWAGDRRAVRWMWRHRKDADLRSRTRSSPSRASFVA